MKWRETLHGFDKTRRERSMHLGEGARDTTSDLDSATALLELDPEWFEPRGYPLVAAELEAMPRSMSK